MVVCVLGLIIAEYIRPDYYIVADGKKWEVDACGGEVVIEFNTNIPENRLYISSSSWIEVHRDNNYIVAKCHPNDESGDNETHMREGYIRLEGYDFGLLGLDREKVSKYVSINQHEDSTKTCGGIDKVWFTTNENGIRIHVDFEVRYVDVSNYDEFSCIVWACDDEDNPVISDDEAFTNSSSEVRVRRTFNPDDTFKKYKNFRLFLPYKVFAHSSLENRTKLHFIVELHELSNGKWRQFAKESDIEFDFPENFSSNANSSEVQENKKMELPTGSNSSSTSEKNTSNYEKENNTKTVIVEHHRDPMPVQEWQDCNICLGSGTCQTCYGSGTNWNGNRCISCNYSGKCNFCHGQGGRYRTVYR